MPKFALFARNLTLVPELMEKFTTSVTQSQDVTPGQLRENGGWYYLTYLRTIKVANFNAKSFELEKEEKNSIRAVTFKIQENKCLVCGGKGEIKEIAGYLEALALPLNKDKEFDCNKFFQFQQPIIDLQKIIELLESIKAVSEIRKVRMRKVAIKLGNIDNCIINTQDYGMVRAMLGQEDNQIFGMEVFLKEPAKTSVYYDEDAQVRVISKDPDIDVEKLALEFALRL